MSRPTLVQLSEQCVVEALKAKQRNKFKEEKTLLDAALILARRSGRAPNLVQFIVETLADVGNPYKHNRSGALDPSKPVRFAAAAATRGMVGCGTIEMMKRSRIRDMLRNFPGISGYHFFDSNIVRVCVYTEAHGLALPKQIFGRAITYKVVGAIKEQSVEAKK